MNDMDLPAEILRASDEECFHVLQQLIHDAGASVTVRAGMSVLSEDSPLYVFWKCGYRFPTLCLASALANHHTPRWFLDSLWDQVVHVENPEEVAVNGELVQRLLDLVCRLNSVPSLRWLCCERRLCTPARALRVPIRAWLRNPTPTPPHSLRIMVEEAKIPLEEKGWSILNFVLSDALRPRMRVENADARVLAAYFIEQKADVNARDGRGNTPLMCAVSLNRPDIGRLLIQHRAEFTLTNNSGNTFLDEVISNHLYDVSFADILTQWLCIPEVAPFVFGTPLASDTLAKLLRLWKFREPLRRVDEGYFPNPYKESLLESFVLPGPGAFSAVATATDILAGFIKKQQMMTLLCAVTRPPLCIKSHHQDKNAQEKGDQHNNTSAATSATPPLRFMSCFL